MNPSTFISSFLLIGIMLSNQVIAQDYTSYFTGNDVDANTSPEGGICQMGGATEDDNAMKWFLERADGGDVLVLRASGSDGYNDYLYTDLDVSVNSVETIVFHNANASTDAYIIDRIDKAEAIWFAGGDQWNYISYWRNTQISIAINAAISERNVVIGGTSAGMAILGGHYFTAENGTITSNAALANPFDSRVILDSLPFISKPILSDVVTDTHYDNPERKGRHFAFMARILDATGIPIKGIACDEYTAVCIDEQGLASVFGGYPTYDDNAYFIQVTCEPAEARPEILEQGKPLTWNLNQKALRVYKVQGRSSGSGTFDLNDWESGAGGEWQNWYVEKGVLFESNQFRVCKEESPLSALDVGPVVFPNPSKKEIYFRSGNAEMKDLRLLDVLGRNVGFISEEMGGFIRIEINEPGLYFLEVLNRSEHEVYRIKIE